MRRLLPKNALHFVHLEFVVPARMVMFCAALRPTYVYFVPTQLVRREYAVITASHAARKVLPATLTAPALPHGQGSSHFHISVVQIPQPHKLVERMH